MIEKDADTAAQEVRDRVNPILPLLPRTITQLTIEKQHPAAQPIFTLALTAETARLDPLATRATWLHHQDLLEVVNVSAI